MKNFYWNNKLSAFIFICALLVAQRGHTQISTSDFSAATFTISAGNSSDLVIADFDGDGVLDVVVAASGGGASIEVFRGISSLGTINFETPISFATTSNAHDVVVGDINQDGKMDVIAVSGTDNTISVLLNTSTGTGNIAFSTVQTFATPADAVNMTIGDLDNDGLVDILVSGDTDDLISIFRNTTAASSTTVSFDTRVDVATLSGAGARPVAIGDLDNDGKKDILVGNTATNNVTLYRNNTTGAGNISFTLITSYSVNNPRDLVIADYDGDGLNDVAITSADDNLVKVYKNNSVGTGNFLLGDVTNYDVGVQAYRINTGDLDNDGDTDLVVSSNVGDAVFMLINNSTTGAISFEAKINLLTSNSPSGIGIADLTGNGSQDILFGSYSIASMTALRNTYVAPNTLAADSLALLALYNSAGGASWSTPWDLAQPMSTWNGVTIAGSRVTQLDLNSRSLSGTIPTEIGDLTGLTLLYLYTNQLTGSIPAEIGNLTNLNSLFLGRNQLSGSIPPEIGNLTMLTGLSIHRNLLTGSIPAEIGNLTSLLTLYLYDNQLVGSIPTEIGNLINLNSLFLGINQLNGSIPVEIGNLTGLTGLSIHINNLTGSIPPEIGNLTSLETLYLYANQLTGSIPAEIGNLTTLSNLNLSSNQLNGSIPAEIGNMSMLTFLILNENQLTGSIPPELGNLTILENLSLNGNLLSGSIPVEIGSLSSLTELALSTNQLTGSIPIELGNMTSLNSMYLGFNQLTGSIPIEIGNMTALSTFNIESNQLSGAIPAEIGNMTNLYTTNLSANKFTSVPVQLTNLANLAYLNIDDNLISNLPNLSTLPLNGHLRVENNKIGFTDIIPNLQLITDGKIFSYDPQVIEDTVRATLSDGAAYTMSTNEVTSGTSYQWYLDGNVIGGATSNSYSITVSGSNLGAYTCQMTNSSVSGLTITRAPYILKSDINNEALFTSFGFNEQVANTTIFGDFTISTVVANGTDIGNLTATFTLSSGATAAIGGTPQESGVTMTNFTSPITYTVTAQDGTTIQDWVVTVIEGDPLIAEYDFSGNVIDQSSFGNDGVLGDGSTTTTYPTFITDSLGIANRALSFDGDDYVTVAHDLSLNLRNATDVSFSGWFNTTSTTESTLFDKSDGLSGYRVKMLSDGSLYLDFFQDGIGGVNLTSAVGFNDGNWHHFVGSIDRDAGLWLYMDGVLSTSQTWASTTVIPDTNEPLRLGVAKDGGTGTLNSYFVGALDEFKFFHQSLTETEAVAIYNSDFFVSTETDVTSFSLSAQVGVATIDGANNTISLEVQKGTDLTTLSPDIAISSGATISPISGEVQDFTNPVVYTVTAEDMVTTQDWQVTVFINYSTAADIISFSFPTQTGPATIGSNTISVEVPYTSDIAALTPSITFSGFASINPLSDVAQDFSNPFDYTVTAEDGVTTKVYTVSVSQTVNPDKVPYQVEWISDRFIEFGKYMNDNLYVTADRDIGDSSRFFLERHNEYGHLASFSERLTVYPSSDVNITDMRMDASGNIYAFGSFRGSIKRGVSTVYTAQGADDMILIKYDIDGNIVAINQIDGSGNEDGYGLEILPSGNLLISFWYDTDFTYSGVNFSIAAGDRILAEFDPNLALVKTAYTASFGYFAKTSSDELFMGGGGTVGVYQIDPTTLTVLDSYVLTNTTNLAPHITKIGVTSNDDIVIASSESSSGNDQIFVGKFRPSTSTWLWSETAGGVGNDGEEVKLGLDANDNIYIYSTYYNAWAWGTNSLSNKGDRDLLLTKFDTNGQQLWLQTYGSDAQDYAHLMAVEPNSGDVMIDGYLSGFGGMVLDRNVNQGYAFYARLSQEGAVAPLVINPINGYGFGQTPDGGSAFNKDSFDDQISDAFTIEAIVRFDAFGDNSTSDDGFNAFLATDFFSFYYDFNMDGTKYVQSYLADEDTSNPDGDYWIGSDMVVLGFDAQEWHHLALTYQNQILTIYFDGFPVKSEIFDWQRTSTISDLRIIENHDAQIDEVRIWNDVHTAAEIRAGATTEIDATSTGLVGYWQFNEAIDNGDGSFSVADATANNQDLTIQSTGAVKGVIEVPTFAETTGITQSEFTINWNTVTDATTYHFQVATDDQFVDIVQDIEGTNGTGYGLNGFAANTTYYVRINATDGITTSAWSATLQVLTIANLQQGLVAHYTFTAGSGSDFSGNSNDLTASSGISTGVDRHNVSGDSYVFDGTSQYMTANSLVGYPTGDDPISYVAWVNPSTTQTSTILDIGQGSTGNGSKFSLNNGKLSYAIYDVDEVVMQSDILLNEWTHVAVTKNGQSIVFYINGEEVENLSISTGQNMIGSSLTIGANLGLTSGFFSGSIDDIRIYNETLDAATISQIYEEEALNLIASIQIVGSGVANAALEMVKLNHPDTGIPDTYGLVVQLEDGTIQFRYDNDDDQRWGDNEPDNTAELDGSVISVSAGLNMIQYNYVTNAYSISVISSIGILGDATVNGWSSDINMNDQGNGVYKINSIDLVTGEWKIRANDDWNVANWGDKDGGNTLALFESNIANTMDGTFSVTVDILNNTYSIDDEISNPPSMGEPSYNPSYLKGSGGSTVSVNVTDPDGDLESVTIYYRNGSETVNNEMVLSNDGVDNFEIVFQDSDFDDLGIAFYFSATDGKNIVSTDTVAIATELADGDVSITGLKNSKDSLNYAIISMPYQRVSVATILGSLGAADKEAWRMFHYNGSGYTELSTSSSFEPGKGYWFLNAASTTLSLGQGKSVEVDENSPFEMVLRNGQNQIGNPFPYTLDWTEVINYNSNNGVSVNNVVVWVSGSGYTAGNTTLRKFQGAFLSHDAAESIYIPVSAINPSGGRIASDEMQKMGNQGVPGKGNWQFGLNLENNTLKYYVPSIGMNQAADFGIDSKDLKALPRLAGYLDLVFDQGVTQDMIPVIDDYKWSFTVQTNYLGEQTTLSWDNYTLQGLTSGLFLYDNELNRFIDMSQNSSYRFTPTSTQHGFELYFGDKASVQQLISADNNFMGTPFPNPSQGRFVVPFAISNDATDVTVVVRDLAGRAVYTQQAAGLYKGYHEIDIDLNSDVPTGTYIIEIGISGTGRNNIFRKKIIYTK